MLREGDSASVYCHSRNPPSLVKRKRWLDPTDSTAEEANSANQILAFRNISRAQAGTYTCLLMADSHTVSADIEVTVVDCELIPANVYAVVGTSMVFQSSSLANNNTTTYYA